MSNEPRPFDISDPMERDRLMREVASFIKVSAFYHEGTDKSGREYAGFALMSALKHGYRLMPPDRNPAHTAPDGSEK